MIQSMTGYGDAQCEQDGMRYALEIRSLNNRYFKPSIKLPEHIQFLESEVEKLLRRRLERGSIYFTLRIRNSRADAAHEINQEALRSYLRHVERLETGAIALTVDLGSLLALPGVCQPPELDEQRRVKEWATTERLANEALDRLIAMRTAEGRALCSDLMAHCEAIRDHLERIRERAPLVVSDYQKRLRTRVEALVSDAELELNQADLIREVAIFAERCDIAEELSRLGSHLDQFTRMCENETQAGRRLEFLAQEMLREANTIAAKANDAEIARQVVDIKGLIDRLKEQSHNVE